ncbi:hypothetical protein HAX54_014881 [Datura stramonium]|uniref:Uncharacterized protein n=1 Tax=Datura stramonium TaxID=4076 RepID=A0ABS8TR14_DATST|nr:hypothetical protein [Datura stramonium]
MDDDELEELWQTQRDAVDRDLSGKHEQMKNSLQDGDHVSHDEALEHTNKDDSQKKASVESNPEEGPGSDAGESSNGPGTILALKEENEALKAEVKDLTKKLLHAHEILNDRFSTLLPKLSGP